MTTRQQTCEASMLVGQPSSRSNSEEGPTPVAVLPVPLELVDRFSIFPTAEFLWTSLGNLSENKSCKGVEAILSPARTRAAKGGGDSLSSHIEVLMATAIDTLCVVLFGVVFFFSKINYLIPVPHFPEFSERLGVNQASFLAPLFPY